MYHVPKYQPSFRNSDCAHIISDDNTAPLSFQQIQPPQKNHDKTRELFSLLPIEKLR